MWGPAQSAAWSILVAFVLSAAITLIDAHDQYFLAHGFHRLILQTWIALLPSALLLACGCGLAAYGLRRIEARISEPSALASTAGLAASIAGTIPLFVWAALTSPRLSRLGTVPLAFGLAIVLVLHGVGYTLARRRRIRDASGPGSDVSIALMVAAGIALLGYPIARVVDAHWHPKPVGAAPAPNILLIVLDTVRADRLSMYGYRRPTSPELDHFAGDHAIRFDNFYSTSAWTVPSHASLFTGLYPVQHRATQERRWLPSEFATLAEILRNAGYATWGASANPNVGERINLTRGFEHFVATWDRETVQALESTPGLPSEHPNNLAFARFLAERDPARPYFAFINYIDAHVPLAPPSPYLERFFRSPERLDRAAKLGRLRSHEHYVGAPYSDEDLAALSDLYDAEIAYLSHVVGELISFLREHEGYDDTLIIITSDHGEHFGEQGLLGHMFGLYNTTVRIPLLIRLPHDVRAGDEDRRSGQLVDLFATLLEVAGVEAPEGEIHGASLLDSDAKRRDRVLSEYYYPLQELGIFSAEELANSRDRLAPYMRRLRALQRYGYRFIQSSDGHDELYNVLRDPGETHNLLDEPEGAAIAEKLRAELASTIDELLDGSPDPFDTAPVTPRKDATELDDDERDALRALGYVR